jgi:O-antigen/teichoic acid export membrane protein
LIRSRLTGQSAIFTLASALVMVLGAVGKAILAGQLSPTGFGTLAFGISFLTFTAIFFEFGAFTPAARRIAHASGAERSELIGASLAIFVPIGLLFCIAVFVLSFTVTPVFGINAGGPLRVSSPIAFAYAFSVASTQVAQGADRFGARSLADLIGQVAFIIALIAASALGRLTVTLALLINSAGLLVTVVVFTVALRPHFARVVEHSKAILHDARTWGVQLYIGRVLSIGTYNMDVLMVGAFANPKAVGLYVLATALAQASGLPMVGLGGALFAPLARAPRLEARWPLIAWGFGAVGIVGVVALAPVLLDLFFSPAYRPVAGLAFPLALAQAVRGVTTIYNTFLSAHGRGRELRNCGIVLTGSNLVLNFALIPPFGATGAAWASFAALVANYAGHIYYYRRADRAPATVPT